MVIIYCGQFALGSTLSPEFFKGFGVFPIRVICDKRYYGSKRSLMFAAMRFVRLQAPKGCEIISEYKPVGDKSGRDETGKLYFDELTFDGEIVAYCAM